MQQKQIIFAENELEKVQDDFLKYKANLDKNQAKADEFSLISSFTKNK